MSTLYKEQSKEPRTSSPEASTNVTVPAIALRPLRRPLQPGQD